MTKIISYQKQKYVKSRNEKAFTLLEVLFAFTIFTIIIFFMAPVFQIILNQSKSEASLQAMEWEVFCSQVKKEIRMSTRAELISNRLALTNNSDTILYEKYGTNLRRRVNSTGHEILLQNVEEVTFILLNNAVKINVKDTWGKEYTVTVYSYIDWKMST